MKRHRTFICIDLPDAVVKEVARVQGLLNKMRFNGKLTELENLHLTLKFLGEIDEEILEEVKKRLKSIKFNEMELRLGKSGVFSYNGKPRIVWIDVNGKGLFSLQEKIDSVLEGLFSKEMRFMGHLTVGRVKFVKDKKKFIKYVSNISVKKVDFKINEFKLNVSELKPAGPVYTAVEVYKSK